MDLIFTLWWHGRIRTRCPRLKFCKQIRHCCPSSRSWDPDLTLTVGSSRNTFSGRGSSATDELLWSDVENSETVILLLQHWLEMSSTCDGLVFNNLPVIFWLGGQSLWFISRVLYHKTPLFSPFLFHVWWESVRKLAVHTVFIWSWINVAYGSQRKLMLRVTAFL